MKSEHTKNMEQEALDALQKQVEAMTEEELEEFRNSFNEDDMGFFGEEGEIDDHK